MHIKSLELSHFRNYDSLKLEVAEGINLFYGDNAQGKTNILESIYICGTTKSHKGSKDRDIIMIGKEEAHIRMILDKNGIEHRIDIHLRKNKAKGIAVDGIPLKRSGELIGFLPVIFFSPEDLGLIKNGPSERRRFLDMELCQIDRLYLYHLTRYNKILGQRNNLLKQISQQRFGKDADRKKQGLLETVPVWDIQLLEYGVFLIQVRKRFIEELNVVFQTIYERLTGGKEQISLAYAPDVQEGEFEKKLSGCMERDIALKATGSGPHRDDLVFLIGGRDARKFGSQGQQRTAALSLKLAEIELMKRKVKDNPVLLLDDVFSELDRSRQNYLLESLENVQTLITCTGLEEFVKEQIKAGEIYQVVEGTVTKKG